MLTLAEQNREWEAEERMEEARVRNARAAYAERSENEALPGRLSELLRIAVRDVRELEGELNPAEKREWRPEAAWLYEHGTRGRGGEACRFCLAGAVIARRIGRKPGVNIREFEECGPDAHGLTAIESARAGDWIDAWEEARLQNAARIQLRQTGGEEGPLDSRAGIQGRKQMLFLEQTRPDGLEWSAVKSELEELQAPEHGEFKSWEELGRLCAELEGQIPELERMEREHLRPAEDEHTGE